MCPSCGLDLKASGVLERDGFRLEPTGKAYYNGELLKIAPQPVELLYALAKADGRTLAYPTLLRRISIGAEDLKLPGVVACRLRAKLKSQGIPIPFKTDWGFGLFWACPT